MKNIETLYKSDDTMMSNGKMLLAAIGGAAAGIAIAGFLGSEKGKALMGKLTETANQFAEEHKDQLNFENISNLIMSKLKNVR